MENLFSEPWFLVFYGWCGYNIYALMRARKKFDKDKSGYLSLKEILYYLKVESLPILFSIWLIPVGVYKADEIWVWLMDLADKDWPFGSLVYIGMGCLSAIVQFIIGKFTNGKHEAGN